MDADQIKRDEAEQAQQRLRMQANRAYWRGVAKSKGNVPDLTALAESDKMKPATAAGIDAANTRALRADDEDSDYVPSRSLSRRLAEGFGMLAEGRY